MGELEAAWMMLYDALGIGRAPEPTAIAAVFLASLLSIFAGMAIGKFILWLPDAIRWFFLNLLEILGSIVHLLLGRAPEDKKVQPREQEAGKEDEEEAEDEVETDLEEKPGEKLPKKIPKQLDENFYLEGKLSCGQREELLGRGYERLKTSVFGDSGASYYLVRVRWNESALHAFFCFLIEDELKKRGKATELFVNNGPDVVFEHKGRAYCFDVETGTNLARDKGKVARKFGYYAHEYYRSHIFVTSKKLKHKYKRYGIVITRASLLKALTGILG